MLIGNIGRCKIRHEKFKMWRRNEVKVQFYQQYLFFMSALIFMIMLSCFNLNISCYNQKIFCKWCDNHKAKIYIRQSKNTDQGIKTYLQNNSVHYKERFQERNKGNKARKQI